MSKLTEVKEAKALMTEAREWSVFKWLWEKSSVRAIADHANAALDRTNRRVKAHWSDEAKAAYRQLGAAKDRATDPSGDHAGNGTAGVAHPKMLQLIRNVKEMDEKARSARMEAERTFNEAESQMSTDLAREGCRKAIHSWELHEKAIRAAEALVESVAQKSHSW